MKMREIKFRGKSDKYGWVYGNLSYREEDGNSAVFIEDQGYCGDLTPVERDTIGQYTGLKDANGKEIYEGDLLRFPPKTQWEETNYVSFEVFFHDGDCCDGHIGFQMNRVHYHGSIGGTTCWPFQPKWTKQMIVEGNIHDNPDSKKK